MDYIRAPQEVGCKDFCSLIPTRSDLQVTLRHIHYASLIMSTMISIVAPQQALAAESLPPPPPLVERARMPVIERIESNCYLLVKSKIPTLPSTKFIKSNSISPVKNQVVVLDYDGLTHYAYILEVKEDGIKILESNFGKEMIQERFLTWSHLTEHKAFYYRVPDIDN